MPKKQVPLSFKDLLQILEKRDFKVLQAGAISIHRAQISVVSTRSMPTIIDIRISNPGREQEPTSDYCWRVWYRQVGVRENSEVEYRLSLNCRWLSSSHLTHASAMIGESLEEAIRVEHKMWALLHQQFVGADSPKIRDRFCYQNAFQVKKKGS